MIITGKIIHEDNERIIELSNYKDQVKTYKIYQMQKPCFCCKKKVHRDAGKYLMNDKIKRLNTPKFFCIKHYREALEIIKLLK